MNAKKFFEEAKNQGIEPFELVYSKSSAISFSVFNDDVENYKVDNDSSLKGRGIFEGKIGSYFTDRTDVKAVEPMMKAIKAGSCYGYEGDASMFLEKGLKYKRVNAFSKENSAVSPETLIQMAKKISANVRKMEPRIESCEVVVNKSENYSELSNSKGLSLKEKNTVLYVYGYTKIVNGDNVESGFKIELIDDFSKFDADLFAKELVEESVKKLGGASLPSGKYNVIYDRSVIPSLLRPLLSHLSAFDVKQHLSYFEGKVGTQVLSKKLTVVENPWVKGCFASSFDAEGYPTSKKNLISAGVVNTYIYDMSTAKEDGVISTGNGHTSGGNIRPRVGYVEVRKGRLSLEEMAEKIGKGVYVTSLGGIGTGLNVRTGDYSLQAEGFLVEDGKITKPVTLFTVAGNLFQDFNKIIAVGSDAKVLPDEMCTPSIAIRKLSISGK